MSTTRPKSSIATIVSTFIVVTSESVAGLHTAKVPMFYLILIAVVLVLLGLARTVYVWTEREPQSMTVCDGCGRELPSWFVSEVMHATQLGSVTALNYCGHCDRADAYPLANEAEDAYHCRVRATVSGGTSDA